MTLLPSARRLIDSLRDIGYDLPSSVADIVDNSVAAEATQVDLTFRFAGLDSSLVIADNGHGMSPSAIDEAMRYGTQRTYKAGELGRFGLGLKTASLSQCRCLTVATRQSQERRRIAIRRWDLDDVLRRNRWDVLKLSAEEAPSELVAPLETHCGTVVMWEGLDRLLDYRFPDGASAERGFATLTEEVRGHLAMVFHRFLAGEARGRRRLRLTVNGQSVAAWDPFARSEPNTKALPPQVVSCTVWGGRQQVRVQPFVLPPQQRFSSAAAHVRAAGPSRWNRQQGLYFYRNDRLVQAGGWNRLRTSDEHTKLARIAIELPEGGEAAFGLNVAKMRVTLPRELRNELMAIASGVAAEAMAAYRGSNRVGVYRQRELTSPSPAHAAEARLVEAVSAAELDLLRTVAAVIRAELGGEQDLMRRVLSRIDRMSLSDAVELGKAEGVKRRAAIAGVTLTAEG